MGYLTEMDMSLQIPEEYINEQEISLGKRFNISEDRFDELCQTLRADDVKPLLASDDILPVMVKFSKSCKNPNELAFMMYACGRIKEKHDSGGMLTTMLAAVIAKSLSEVENPAK